MEIGIREIEALGNTPGEWYGVAYVISALLFLSANRKSRTGWQRYLSIFGIGTAISVFMRITSGVSGLGFAIVIGIVVIALYTILALNMDGDCKKHFYYTLRSFMLGEFIASFGWQLYYFAATQLCFGRGFISQASVMVPVAVMVVLVAIPLEKQHSKGNRELEISGQALGGAAIMVLSIYLFSNMSYVVTGTPFTTVYSSELFIIRTFADLMGVFLLYFYHELLQQIAEKVEERTLRNMLELQYSQYQVSEESIALVNQKYHDLKHQITMLKTSIGKQEGTEYLDQMLDEIKQYEAQYKTGNRVLDTMLAAEAMKCQAREIELTCVADGAALSFMEPMDISSLFGNALDNAIESAEQIPEKSERLIYLSVNRQKSFLKVYVENRYAGRVTFRHHLPQTSKEDKQFHGYGVKSMKQVAEKYGGSIRAEAEDGWFKLSVLIPIPAEVPTKGV